MMNRRAAVMAAWTIGSLVVASSAAQGPGGWGPAGPGHGKPSGPGTVAPIPVDPARPWGWAVRAFMDDPDQPLYNTTKQKLLQGRQVFSQTINRFDIDAYCKGAQTYDFSRFEMQHSTLQFGDVEKMIAACPRVPATPILRIPDAEETHAQNAGDIGNLGIVVPTVD